MFFRALILTLLIHSQASYATSLNIHVGYGRLSLIDLGSIIQSPVTILDPTLINVYELSGLSDENNKSILAIQGLAQEGNTDITVRSNSGTHQFHIILTTDTSEDLSLNPKRSRSLIYPKTISLQNSRMSIVELNNPINEFVLAGNPNLIGLKQIVSNTDSDFLKTFALVSKKQSGKTDLVIAAQDAVYKLAIELDQDLEHQANIKLTTSDWGTKDAEN